MTESDSLNGPGGMILFNYLVRLQSWSERGQGLFKSRLHLVFFKEVSTGY